ncbi:MAG: LiaF transmembrane domain-containing protein [Erysipelotrichaceae bacterium]
MRKSSSISVMGLFFVAVGIAYLGDAMHYWNFSIFFPGWWTLFLILPAVSSFLNYGFGLFKTLVLFVGLYYLSLANGWPMLYIQPSVLFGVILIGWGCKLLFPKRRAW